MEWHSLSVGRDNGGHLVHSPSQSEVPVQHAQHVAMQALPEPPRLGGVLTHEAALSIC
jgi:hypothetical protein